MQSGSQFHSVISSQAPYYAIWTQLSLYLFLSGDPQIIFLKSSILILTNFSCSVKSKDVVIKIICLPAYFFNFFSVPIEL